MEIIFLWTRNHHPFEENFFNFNGNFNVLFTKSEEDKTIQIDISKNESFPDNFFGDEIQNISCFIGKNGSGKTRILNLLADINSEQWNYISDYILITYSKERSQFYIRHNLFEEDDSRHPRKRYRGEKLYSFELNLPKGFKKATKGYLKKVQVVYFAPFLDLKYFPTRVNEKTIVDVSTDFLIITDKDSNKKEDEDYLVTHRFKNVERQFDFVTKFSDRLDINGFFQIPTTIDVTCLESKYDEHYYHNLSPSAREIREYFIGNNKPDKRGVIFDELHDIGGRDHKLREQGKSISQEYKDLQLERVRMHFLNCFISHYFWAWNTDNHWLKKDIGVTPEEFKGLDEWDACRILLEKETWTKDNGTIGISIINKIDELLSAANATLEPIFNNNTISTENLALVKELINLQFEYLPTLPNYGGANSSPDIFQINWRNLSSGEKAFLDLFSRLNYANTLLRQKDVDKYKQEVTPTEWLYLLIDEGEIGFHPEWQKNYVNLLHKMTPFLFPNLKIQVILTSHSPFIASDVPLQNIVFLNKLDGMVTVNNDLNFQNTFAANIHTLLADGFFLSNGLIGDFAKNKIQGVIDWLNDTKADLEKSNEMKKLIGLIGEPIVRNKLIDEFNKKLGLDEEIDKIDREVERLNQLKEELLKKKGDAES